MNKIYKVVWSKVKNCYVVVSELAKNVITGSVKSAKVGAAPMAKGLALGAVMAFVITGNAMAADVTSQADADQISNKSGEVTVNGNINATNSVEDITVQGIANDTVLNIKDGGIVIKRKDETRTISINNVKELNIEVTENNVIDTSDGTYSAVGIWNGDGDGDGAEHKGKVIISEVGDVTVTSSDTGIYAGGTEALVQIESDNLTVNAGEYGVMTNSQGNMKIGTEDKQLEKVVINAAQNAGSTGVGIYASGSVSHVDILAKDIEVNSNRGLLANQGDISLGSAEHEAESIKIETEADAIEARYGNLAEVYGKNVSIESKTGYALLGAVNQGGDINIAATEKLDIKGDIKNLTTSSDRSNFEFNINQGIDDAVVTIVGDVVTDYNGKVNINLGTEDSSLRGTITDNNDSVTLNMNSGTWFVTGKSKVKKVSGDSSKIVVNDLTENSVIIKDATDLKSVTLGAGSQDLGVDIKAGLSSSKTKNIFDKLSTVVVKEVTDSDTGATTYESVNAVDNVIDSVILQGELDYTYNAETGEYSNVTTTIKPGDKLVIDSDVEVTGDVKAATFNGIDLKKTLDKKIENNATGAVAVGIGYGAEATGTASIAIGYGMSELGQPLVASGYNAIAIGTGTNAENYSATAVGAAASATGWGSLALGYVASAEGKNSVAIGTGSIAKEDNVVSFGSGKDEDPNQYRKLVNVADGKDDYDAVNVGQLNAATANTKGISRTQYDGTTTGETKVTDDFVVDTKEGKGSFTMGYIYDEVANETNEMFIAKKLIDDGSYSTTMLINAQNGEIWTAASVTADAGMNAGKKANGTYAFSANANGAAVNGTLTTTGNTSLANGVLTATYVEGGVHEVSVQGNQKVTGGVAVGGAVAAQGDVTAGVNEKGEGGVSLLKTAADLSKLNDDVIKTNETLKTTNDNLTKLNGDVERIDAQVTENTEAIAAETEARKKDIVNVTDHINTVSTNVTEHVNAVQKDLSAAIQAETAAREEHVNAVQKDLSAAINANSAAIESNAAAIEANSQAIAIETAERKADIQNVTNHINTVQKDLSAAIDNVSANVTSHVNAVQKDLSAAINAETAAREEHVNAVQKDLSAAIQENSQAIATETEARKADVANVTSHVNAVQKDLSNAIQAETAAREEHVNAVQKDLSSAIQAETAAREEHVNAVQKDLSSAIQENTAAISAEEQARIAGDEANAAAISNNAEAISGLNQRLGKMNGKINKVGAGAAALAALHPLDYDPDDKLTFSAGVGNYAGENAMALGAFYRPDEKLMFSLGGTMGNGENMVNLGVSIGLDGAKGTPKLSKKELVQKVSTMEAENQAIKAENEALEERVAKLEALVAKLAEK